MEEAASARRADPVAFRLGLLDAKGRNAGSAPNAVGGTKRQAAVLRHAAQLTSWDVAMPENSGLGVATTVGQKAICCLGRPVLRASGLIAARERSSSMPARLWIRVRPRSGRGRRPLGSHHGAARRCGIRCWPGEGYQSRHLYAASHRRGPRPRYSSFRHLGGSSWPRRACDDSNCTRHRQRNLCCPRRRLRYVPIRPRAVLEGLAQTVGPPADRVPIASSQSFNLICWPLFVIQQVRGKYFVLLRRRRCENCWSCL